MTPNTKDWIQYSTAIVLVVSAITIAFINFFISHMIHSSVLVYISQALVYAAGIFGVSLYFHNKLGEFENKVNQRLQSHEEEKLRETIKEEIIKHNEEQKQKDNEA